MLRDYDSINDIVDSMRLIMDDVRGMTKDQFLNDRHRYDSMILRIAIIGEATKRVSEDTRRQHPKIPWRHMARMRDRLIHGYDDIDLDIVWATATESIPEALPLLEALLRIDDLEPHDRPPPS